MKRYWLTMDDGILIREWSSIEYNSLNPCDRISEDVLYHVCMCCGKPKSTATHIVTDTECKIVKDIFSAYCSECLAKHNMSPKKKNNGYKQIKTNLKCMEISEKELGGKICSFTTVY